MRHLEKTIEETIYNIYLTLTWPPQPPTPTLWHSQTPIHTDILTPIHTLTPHPHTDASPTFTHYPQGSQGSTLASKYKLLYCIYIIYAIYNVTVYHRLILLPWLRAWFANATFPDSRYRLRRLNMSSTEGMVMKEYATQALWKKEEKKTMSIKCQISFK